MIFLLVLKVPQAELEKSPKPSKDKLTHSLKLLKYKDDDICAS